MAAKREGIATNDANSGPSHAEPQIAPPPWQRLPDRPGRRRREPISREAIVTAAIRLLDREGLAALSMRRLAEELGTGAASLYWHVGSKDGLLDLVFDELIGEEQVPEADPSRWQEQLKDIARAQRRVSLRHPYLVRISIGRIPMGPNALRFSERVIAILRAGGLPPRLAVQGYLLLISTVNGFTVDETGVQRRRPGRPGRQRPARRPGQSAGSGEHGPRLRRVTTGRAVPEHGRPRRRVCLRRRRRALRDAHRYLRGRAGPPGGGILAA